MSVDLHPVNLENLADWLDGRLAEDEAVRVAAHLATHCPQCEADVSWLRRIKAAGRVPGMVDPPAELVAKAKALCNAPRVPRHQYTGVAHRTWSLRPILAVAASLIVVVGLSLGVLRRPTILAQEAVLVTAPEPVEVRQTGQSAWQPVPGGDALPEGMQLKMPMVGEAAVVRLFDGTSLTAGPGAELTLGRLRSGLISASREIALSQEAGEVLYEVAPLPDGQSTFRVQSPGAQILVRGTRFIVAVDEALETYVIVLEGRVEIVGAVEEQLLAAREAAVVSAQGLVKPLPTLSPVDLEINPTGSRREWLSNMLKTVMTATPAPSATTVPVTPAAPSATAKVTPMPSRTLEQPTSRGNRQHQTGTPADPGPTPKPSKTSKAPTLERTPKPWATRLTPGPWPPGGTPWPRPTGGPPYPWPTGMTPPATPNEPVQPTRVPKPQVTPPVMPTINWTPPALPTPPPKPTRFKSPIIPTLKPQPTRGQPTEPPTPRSIPTKAPPLPTPVRTPIVPPPSPPHIPTMMPTPQRPVAPTWPVRLPTIVWPPRGH